MAEHLSTKSPNLILFKPSAKDDSFYFMKKIGKMSCFHTVDSKKELNFVHKNSECPHCSNIGADNLSVFRTLSMDEENLTLEEFSLLALSSKENLKNLTRYEEWLSPRGLDPIFLAKNIYFNNKYIFEENHKKVLPHFGNVLIYDIKTENIPYIYRTKVAWFTKQFPGEKPKVDELVEKFSEGKAINLYQYILNRQFSFFLYGMLSEICINYEPYVDKIMNEDEWNEYEKDNYSRFKRVKEDFSVEKINPALFRNQELVLSKGKSKKIEYKRIGFFVGFTYTIFLFSSYKKSDVEKVTQDMYSGNETEIEYFEAPVESQLLEVDDSYDSKTYREYNSFRQWNEIIKRNRETVFAYYTILESTQNPLKTLFKNFVHPDASSSIYLEKENRIEVKKAWKQRGQASTTFEFMSHKAFKDDYFEKYTISQYESLFYYYSMAATTNVVSNGGDMIGVLSDDDGFKDFLGLWTGPLAINLFLASKSKRVNDLKNLFVFPKFIYRTEEEFGWVNVYVESTEKTYIRGSILDELSKIAREKEKEIFGDIKQEDRSDYHWYYSIIFPNFFRYYILFSKEKKIQEAVEQATFYLENGKIKEYKDKIEPYILERLDYCYSIFQGMCLVHAFLKRSPYGAIEELNWAIFLSWSGIYEASSEETDRSVKRGRMEK